MFFIFDRNNPKQLLFYIIIILFAVLFEYLELVSAPKTIGIGVLAIIVVYVVKTLFGCNCNKKE
ncbi:MAG: hypothetical protein PHS65_08980 [Arcobacteraceae bacterium]|nr:hypothetical protein [Arcobacteraceae bacterium]